VRTVIVDTHVHVISNDQSKYPRTAHTAEWVTDTSGEMLLSLNRGPASTRTCWCKATERMTTTTVTPLTGYVHIRTSSFQPVLF
jgi:hypothetical protein